MKKNFNTILVNSIRTVNGTYSPFTVRTIYHPTVSQDVNSNYWNLLI